MDDDQIITDPPTHTDLDGFEEVNKIQAMEPDSSNNHVTSLDDFEDEDAGADHNDNALIGEHESIHLRDPPQCPPEDHYDVAVQRSGDSTVHSSFLSRMDPKGSNFDNQAMPDSTTNNVHTSEIDVGSSLELVYWRHPIKSGLCLALLMVLQLSLVFCSVISVLAYFSILFLMVNASLRLYTHFTKKTEHPFKEYLDMDLTISRNQTEDLTRKIISRINTWVLVLRDLFLISNYTNSLKFAGVLYILTYIGARFNFLTLCILGTVGMFTLPKIYETYKTEIDKGLGHVKVKIDELMAQLRTKMETIPGVGKKIKAN